MKVTTGSQVAKPLEAAILKTGGQEVPPLDIFAHALRPNTRTHLEKANAREFLWPEEKSSELPASSHSVAVQ